MRRRILSADMDETQLTLTESDEAQGEDGLVVWQWRAEQLQRLGLSRLIAQAFATAVDWHDVARLVERGCSPELALEIVR